MGHQRREIDFRVGGERRGRRSAQRGAGGAGIEKRAAGGAERKPLDGALWPRDERAFGPPIDVREVVVPELAAASPERESRLVVEPRPARGGVRTKHGQRKFLRGTASDVRRAHRRLVARDMRLRPETVEPRDAREIWQLGRGFEFREEAREAVAVVDEHRSARRMRADVERRRRAEPLLAD